MDPLLAQGFSSLTKALIGDPETDYQVSRTGYQNAQTNRLNKLLPYETKSLAAQEAQRLAAAAASTAQGGLYDQKTTDLQTDAANLLALSQSPELAGVAASMFDLGEGANLSPEVGQSILYRLFQEGDANSIASALATMGEGQDFNAARGVVLDESADINERIIANALLGNAPVKYSKPDFAQTELEANNQTDLQQTGLTAGATVEAASINANATTAYQNYKSDLQFGVGGSADREGERKTAQAQWEHENATLEINVEPGKQVVLSPKAGERLGLEPNDEGLYVLDGGPKPGSIVVKVGEEDVYLTEADAKALGIEKNDAGTYMIPGRANPKGSGNLKTVSTAATKFLGETIKTELGASGLEVPDSIQLEVRGDAANLIQEDGNTEAAATFIARALKPVVITEQNLVRFGRPISGFSAPQYVLDQIGKIKEAAQNPSVVPSNILTMLTEDYGYDEDQAKAIMAYANI
jgi:hypothetical protein